MRDIPREFETIKAELRAGRGVERSVRELLQLFGAKRRGWRVVEQVDAALFDAGLVVDPPFAHANLDENVTFEDVDSPASTPPEPAQGASGTASHVSEAAAEKTAPPVHGQRVRSLPAAMHENVLTVTPNTAVREALAQMTYKGYSQLPVVSGEYTLVGAFTLASFAEFEACGKTPQEVRECMTEKVECGLDDSLFSATRKVLDAGHVVVRNKQNRITGIITLHDLTQHLAEIAEPLALVYEIESYLREILKGKLPNGDDELPGFRLYQKLLSEHWDKLCLKGFHKQVVMKALDEARPARNSVAHFNPDGILPEELAALRDFANLMRKLAAA